MYHKCIRILSNAFVVTGFVFAFASTSNADLNVYTDATEFATDAANLGLATDVLDFESIVAGTTFSNPSTVGGITFSNFPMDLLVTDQFAATSGTNYLGVSEPLCANQFIGGFEIDFAFTASQAVGLFVITGETPGFSIFDNDIRLEVAGVGSAQLDVDDLQDVIGGTDNVFFIGLIDTCTQFSQAVIRYDVSAIEAIAFNVDDITTARGNFLLGDVNQDGNVNLLDVDPFINRLSTGQFQLEADINMDGVVNLLDVGPFVDILAGGG